MTALQVNILLLSMGALQGLLLFFLLYKKRRSVPGYIFLAAYLAVLVLQITLKIAGKLWLMKNLGPLYQFSYQLPFLYGPLLYLFVLKFSSYRQPRLRDIYHFLPTIIVISILVMMPPYQLLRGIRLIFFNQAITGSLQLVSIVAYHLVALAVLKKYSNQPALAKWVKQFTKMSMVVCSVVVVAIYLLHLKYYQWGDARFGFVALTFFIYWISYKAWSHPEIFSVIRGNASSVNPAAPMLTVHLPTKKYSNSGLSVDEMRRIVSELQEKMQMEKPFLDPQLTIDELAESLDCSRHHLSQAINEQLHQTFYDYINLSRVNEAKIMLADPNKANQKVAAIAFDAGFNSISTFNEVFKKMAGQTPSQYRKQADADRLKKQRV